LPYYLYCLRRRALLRFFIYSTISLRKPQRRAMKKARAGAKRHKYWLRQAA